MHTVDASNETAVIRPAATAHARIDRLLMGVGRAARYRVLKLTAPASAVQLRSAAMPAPEGDPKATKGAASARVQGVRGRLSTLLADGAAGLEKAA